MASVPHVKVVSDPVVEPGKASVTPYEELLNYRQLVARVVDVFGDETKASVWLSTPNSSLNGETPLRAAQRNAYDLLTLEPILTRIEHGIYW